MSAQEFIQSRLSSETDPSWRYNLEERAIGMSDEARSWEVGE